MSAFGRTKSLQVFVLLVTCSWLLLLASCSSSESNSIDISQKTESHQEHTIPPRPELSRPEEPVLTGDVQTDAVAIAQYFLEFHPYMLKTGDVSYWKKHSTADCSFCQKEIQSISDRNEVGAWIDSEMVIKDTQVREVNKDKGEYQIDFVVERNHVIAHKSNEDEQVTGGEYRVLVDVAHPDDWVVTRFQIGRNE